MENIKFEGTVTSIQNIDSMKGEGEEHFSKINISTAENTKISIKGPKENSKGLMPDDKISVVLTRTQKTLSESLNETLHQTKV